MERKIRLQVGESFRLQLESLSGAGYSWEIEQNNERVTTVELSGAGRPPGKKDPVGGNSIVPVTIKGVEKGTSLIKLVQKRVWETDLAPLKMVMIRVTVV